MGGYAPGNDQKALVQRYFEEVWEKKNPEAVKQFLAPHYRRHTSPNLPQLTLEDQIQRLVGFRLAFPDIEITPEVIVVEGDSIAFRSLMQGTNEGEFLGIAPTGKPVTVYLLDLIRIENGKFVEQWGGPDLFDLLRQLGATVR